MFALSFSFSIFANKKCMKQIYYIAILLSWLLIGCKNKSVSSQLDIIDSLVVAEQSDSAFQLVRSLDDSRIITPEDRAYYNLLMVQTGFLTNHPFPSDSLLDTAIMFYQHNNNRERLADCYYYKGLSRFYANDSIESMLYYKKAEEAAKGGSLSQRYKIAEVISFVNSVTGKYEFALEYAKRALELSKAINNKRWLADAYYRVGISFSNIGLADSAIFYFEKTEPYIKYIKKEDKPYFLSNLGLAYMDRNREKAKQYILEALSYKETTRSLEYLAEIKYEEGNKEVAYQLWERALTINDPTPKDIILHNLFEYNIEHGKTEEVCKQVNEIIAIKDSIISKLKNDTIKDLQTRFDQQVAVNAANECLIRWQWALGGIAFFCICLIVYIFWKKHRIKLQKLEQEMKIRNYAHQILELDIKATKAESQIVALKSTNSQSIEEIKRLESVKANAEEKLMKLAGKEAIKIRKGVLLYDELIKNKKVLTWTNDDYESFVSFYEASNYSAINTIRAQHEIITLRNMLYMILVDMGKTKDEICHIMSLDKDSIRSIKFRLKKKRKN